MLAQTSASHAVPSRPRVLIIGIDGATFDVIHPLVEAGRLPNLGRLMREGCWGPLRSTIPPVTAPAWTSFMTGVNPGRHGIYDFRYRREGTYDLLTNNTTTNRAPMLWEVLSHYGLRCCVMNVPATYPPRPINGEMITGLLTPADAEVFTYPAELTRELLHAIPEYTVWPASMLHPKGRERSFLAATEQLLEMRVRMFRFMQRRGDWDCQMIVFMGVDQVQHAMWHYRDPTHRDYEPHAPAEFRDAIDVSYQHTDSAVGELLKEVDRENTTVLVMSDHGFGPLEDWFHINTWLLSEGLLKLKPAARTRVKRLLFGLGITPLNLLEWSLRLKMGKPVAQTLRNRREWSFEMLRRLFLSFDDVDWSQTVAYSVGYGGPIYLNLAGREPQGIVAPEDYDAVLRMIAGRLRAITDPQTGNPLISEIYFGKDIYSGERARFGPDIMFFMREGRVYAYGNNEFASRRLLTPSFGRTGWHRMDGIFIASGPGIKRGHIVQGSRIWDVYPTILALLRVPIPAGLDGRVLEAILTEDVRRDVRYGDASLDDFFHGVGEGYSDKEEDAVAERLRGLGYM